MLPGNKLYLLVSTCCRQHVSCIGNKIVASLSPVCCWIQRDTSRTWHKWIVIMSPRYSQHVSRTSNLYPATCVRQQICSRIQVVRPGLMLFGNMLSWCKRGFTVTSAVDWLIERHFTKCLSVRCSLFAATLSCSPWLRDYSTVVRMSSWRDVISWLCHWRRRGRHGGRSGNEQLVIVRRAVNGVVDDGQLLSTNESLVARVTCEAVHVKHEFFDPHHQFGCGNCEIAFGTPRLHVPPACVIQCTLYKIRQFTFNENCAKWLNDDILPLS